MSLMPKLRKVLIAGAAVAAAIAIPALAHAHAGKAADANLMTVIRADGSVVQARNTMPVAPRVAVVQVSPFALMNQMAADMDRQMAAQMSYEARSALGAECIRIAKCF
jgi:hypothetical protein